MSVYLSKTDVNRKSSVILIWLTTDSMTGATKRPNTFSSSLFLPSPCHSTPPHPNPKPNFLSFFRSSSLLFFLLFLFCTYFSMRHLHQLSLLSVLPTTLVTLRSLPPPSLFNPPLSSQPPIFSSHHLLPSPTKSFVSCWLFVTLPLLSCLYVCLSGIPLPPRARALQLCGAVADAGADAVMRRPLVLLCECTFFPLGYWPDFLSFWKLKLVRRLSLRCFWAK